MADKPIHVGYTLFDSRRALFRAFELSCLQTEAKNRHVMLTVIEVKTLAEQVAAVDTLLAQQIDALLIRPLFIDEAMQEVINRAMLQMPVISIDSIIPRVTATVRSDHEKGQRLVTEYVFRRLNGRGKVAFLGGHLSSATGVLRSKSFHQLLDSYPDIQLVYETEIKWELDAVPREKQGAGRMREILALHPDVDAIIACSDQDVAGALEVIEEAGLTGRFLVSGYDALPPGLLAISRGAMTATVRQAAAGNAHHALDMALAALQGESVPAVKLTEVLLITKDNVGAAAVQSMQAIPGIVRELADSDEVERQLQRSVISAQYNILQTMSAVAQIVSHVHDSDNMLHKALNLICQRFDLCSAALYLARFEAVTGSSVLALEAESSDATAESSPYRSEIDPTAHSAIASCMANRLAQVVISSSKKEDAGEQRSRAASQVIVPLNSGDKVIGIVDLRSQKNRAFDEDTLMVLQAIADQITLAIENASLYAETVRRATEQEAAAQFLNSIIENIPTPIWVKEAEHLRYLSWNKAGEQIYGTSKEERLGKNVYGIYSKEVADEFTLSDRAALDSGKPVILPEEHVITRTKGERIFHTQKIPMFDANGKPEYLLSIVQDITEQIQTRELLAKRARELENAYQALQENQGKLLIAEKMASLGRLTAGIAHEMNTPLATVRSAMTELQELVREYRRSVEDKHISSEDHREIAQEMDKVIHLANGSAERAAGFVRGVKSQTRDMTKQQLTQFDAVSVIREALLLLEHMLRIGECTAELDAQPDVIELYGSPDRLTQVVTNLVTNAIDASKGKRGCIHLSMTKNATNITLLVSDQGSGIPPEVIDRIFDPMFTTKAFGEGTGLGLALVKDIVASDFGGSISVNSQLGSGTTFAVVFPVVAESR